MDLIIIRISILNRLDFLFIYEGRQVRSIVSAFVELWQYYMKLTTGTLYTQNDMYVCVYVFDHTYACIWPEIIEWFRFNIFKIS